MLARRVVAALDPAIAGPIASVNRALVEARASQHRHMARMLEIYERVRGPAAAREDARAPRARRA
jgi:hypothetical protein